MQNKEAPSAIAAEHGHFHVVKFLVAHGANVHSKRVSCLPIQLFCSLIELQRELSLVQWAAYRCDAEAVQYLVSYGAEADLNVKALVKQCAVRVEFSQFARSGSLTA